MVKFHNFSDKNKFVGNFNSPLFNDRINKFQENNATSTTSFQGMFDSNTQVVNTSFKDQENMKKFFLSLKDNYSQKSQKNMSSESNLSLQKVNLDQIKSLKEITDIQNEGKFQFFIINNSFFG